MLLCLVEATKTVARKGEFMAIRNLKEIAAGESKPLPPAPPIDVCSICKKPRVYIVLSCTQGVTVCGCPPEEEDPKCGGGGDYLDPP